MPYRMFPDGTIETDTVEEMIALVRAIEADPIASARYSMKKDPVKELKLVQDELIKLVRQKSRVDSEIELCLHRQEQIVLGNSKPVTPNKSRSESSSAPPPEEVVGFYAAIGRETHHLENKVAFFGDHLVIYQWGEMKPSELLKKAYDASDATNLNGELSIVPLTPALVELLSKLHEPVIYCNTLGIERPK